jgi:hypothetical protein
MEQSEKNLFSGKGEAVAALIAEFTELKGKFQSKAEFLDYMLVGHDNQLAAVVIQRNNRYSNIWLGRTAPTPAEISYIKSFTCPAPQPPQSPEALAGGILPGTEKEKRAAYREQMAAERASAPARVSSYMKRQNIETA